MSLTRELQNPDSAIYKWFSSRRNDSVDLIIKQHNQLLFAKKPLAPMEGTDFPLVGISVCHYLRKYLAELVGDNNWAEGTSAYSAAIDLGLNNLIEYVKSPPTNPEQEALKALLFAACEKYYRSPKIHEILQPFLNTPGKKFRPSDEFLRKWRPSVLDTAQIISKIPTMWEAVGFAPTGQLKSNATFDLSRRIGGADIQIIVGNANQGNALIDVRTSVKRRPFSFSNFYQQIAYVLLDTSDKYQIRQLVWFYSRQEVVFTYPVSNFFKDLKSLRQEFAQMILDNYPEPGEEDDLILCGRNDYSLPEIF